MNSYARMIMYLLTCYADSPSSTTVTKNIMKQTLLITLLATVLVACSSYKPTVRQGNALDPATVAQIKVGMNKTDIMRILGSPLMQDDFRANRWDYLYYSIERGRRSAQKSLTLHFQNGVVSHIN